MVKNIALFSSLMFVTLSTSAVTITASHDYSYSDVLTDNILVNLDFGVSGRDIDNITMVLSFSGNLWDPTESLGINFPIEIIHSNGEADYTGYQITYFNTTANPLNHFSTTLDEEFLNPYCDLYCFDSLHLNDMYIDNNGLATIRLNSSPYGNGINISNMIVTADLITVPVPASIWLFTSGLIGLARLKKAKKAKKA